MKAAYRNGPVFEQPGGQDRLLAALYGRAAGRLLLKPLTRPGFSRCMGKLLSTRLSRVLIRPFIEKNHIEMSQFEPGPFASYNDFFSRRIRPGARPIDGEPGHLISPCDSKLTVLPITPDSRFTLKHTEYTISSLLRDDSLAQAYSGGYCLIFRLTVDDYHRYCYPVDGEKSGQTVIPGVLHTVNPLANDRIPIYKENTREYCLLHSDTFGDLVMMEVGALMVGKIVNHHGAARVFRGQEKGYFQFGGSTIVLLVKAGMALIDRDILANSQNGVETIVRMGERIGCAP